MFLAIFLVVALMVFIVDVVLVILLGIVSWWQGMFRR